MTCDILPWAKELHFGSKATIHARWVDNGSKLHVFPEILVLPGRLHLPNLRPQARHSQHSSCLPPECLCAGDPSDKSNVYVKQVLKILQEAIACPYSAK